MAGNEQEEARVAEAGLQAALDELAAARSNAMQEGGEPVAGAPQSLPAVGGGPAQRAPAGERQPRKSTFAYVYWDNKARRDKRWVGQLRATSKHPRLKTLRYHTDEEVARAVDRLLYKVRGPEACNFPVTPELAAELDALTVEQVLQQLRGNSDAQGRSGRLTGVSFNSTSGKWEAFVYVKRPHGPVKLVTLGLHATEREAAERVSAAAYLLGDRCVFRGVPTWCFTYLTAGRGRALAMEVLGPATAGRLEQAMQVLEPARRQGDGAPALKRQLAAGRGWSSREEEEEDDDEEGVDLGAADGAVRLAAGASGEQPAPGLEHRQQPQERPRDASGAGAQAAINDGMVADAWLDVWQGLVAQHTATGQAPAASDTSVGCAPHPAVLASAAAAHPGDSPGGQRQAAALAWRAAQAQAEVYAAELGDASLLNPRSLHRLTLLVAYSVLWLQHSPGQPHHHQPTSVGP